MRFEGDEEKARANLAKHGVSFELAVQVFEAPLNMAVRDRHVDGEERWRTVGRVGFMTILFVAHTHLDDDGDIVIRIISARRASKREISAYEQGNEGFFR